MATARRYLPNRQLTWERLERGWSHDELCEQIKRGMRDADEADTGLTGNTVRRWETGERWPDPRFRKHLVTILGKPASQLGLLSPDELSVRPDPSEPLDLMERLLTTVGGQTHENGMSRQRFLRAIIAVGVLPGVAPLETAAERFEPLALAADRGSRVDARVVESYAMITEQHQLLYWTALADSLLPSALGHIQLGIQLLSDGAGELRRDLAGSLAQSALLGARLAFFDLRQVALAEKCFEIATTAMRESGDHALAAAVYAHWSFVTGFAGNGTAAQPLLDAAVGHARYAPGPLLRSWLHCVHSEVSARTGTAAQSVRHARQAEDSLSTCGEDPEWLDFFDPARLASFLGYSQLVAGRTADAVVSLHRALEELDDRAGKQRSVVLLDLAAAHAVTDGEHAMDFAAQAFDQLEREPYGTAYDRIVATACAGGHPAGTGAGRAGAVVACCWLALLHVVFPDQAGEHGEPAQAEQAPSAYGLVVDDETPRTAADQRGVHASVLCGPMSLSRRSPT
jgi:transcriptional regulator with XRE-family HTH domain